MVYNNFNTFINVTPVASFMKSIEFEQGCGSYLKNAADANTPEIALERINHALKYIEDKGLTQGYTSIFWKTEDENVEFWYMNIKACQKELVCCLNGTQLEKSNVLMKVRESLTDNGEKGIELTIPNGIHKFPENGLFVGGYLFSILFACFGIVQFRIAVDKW